VKKKGYRLVLFFVVFGLFVCILTSVFGPTSVDPAFAQGDKNFISSVYKNGIWILNKSNGKMLYLLFAKQGKTFKSNSINVPSNFNLNACQMQAFGSHGKAVLLVDVSSGFATAYKANKDRTVESGINLHYGKGLMFCGKSKNFWILDTSKRELLFIQFKSEKKIKESSPLQIPSNFNLEKSFIRSVGTHGEAVFLFDTSTGSTIFYKITRDYVINEYMNIGVGSDLS